MHVIDAKTLSEGFNIAIVVSRYNEEVTNKLYEGAIARLKELHFSDEQITIVWVPGAVEIPLVAQRLAANKKYEAIVCLGAVIFGETRHFDFVCDQVNQGCQQVALNSDIPVIFGVLTTNDLQQALDRVGGKRGHVGRQSIDAACQMVSVLNQIKE